MNGCDRDLIHDGNGSGDNKYNKHRKQQTKPMAETVFSSLKRMFGEYVSAKKFPNMVKEMMLKASLYNMFIVEK